MTKPVPETYRPLLDPTQPLGEEQDRYFPRVDKVLNMARLVVGLMAIMAGMAWIVATINQDQTKWPLMMAATLVAVAVLVLLLVLGRRAKQMGGDRKRRGVFVLPDGILFHWGAQQEFLPRVDIADFELFMERDLDAEPMLWYPVVEGQTYRKWGFDTVGLVRSIHRDMLQDYLDTGAFSVKRWKRPGEVTAQKMERQEK